MPQNLELKARIRSLKKAEATATGIGARFAGDLRQVDTYFRVRRGRLKLREVDSKKGELIYYRRAHKRGARLSRYVIYPVGRVREAKRLLCSFLQPTVVVRKNRRLYLCKNARIHLDSVRGLGHFVEFEVIVRKGRAQAAGLMEYLRTVFKIDAREIEGGSYGDLLRRKKVLA